jgi:hypothetical protein
LYRHGIVRRARSRKLSTRPTITKLFQRQPRRIKSEAQAAEGFSQNRPTCETEPV